MCKQVVDWQYDRRPGTELYDGRLNVLTPSAQENHGKVYEEFFGVSMNQMLGTLHQFLQQWPETMVHVTRKQAATKFHDERSATITLSEVVVEMIRDNLSEAQKQFEPIAVRVEKEESNASQR